MEGVLGKHEKMCKTTMAFERVDKKVHLKWMHNSRLGFGMMWFGERRTNNQLVKERLNELCCGSKLTNKFLRLEQAHKAYGLARKHITHKINKPTKLWNPLSSHKKVFIFTSCYSNHNSLSGISSILHVNY